MNKPPKNCASKYTGGIYWTNHFRCMFKLFDTSLCLIFHNISIYISKDIPKTGSNCYLIPEKYQHVQFHQENHPYNLENVDCQHVGGLHSFITRGKMLKSLSGGKLHTNEIIIIIDYYLFVLISKHFVSIETWMWNLGNPIISLPLELGLKGTLMRLHLLMIFTN